MQFCKKQQCYQIPHSQMGVTMPKWISKLLVFFFCVCVRMCVPVVSCSVGVCVFVECALVNLVVNSEGC